MVSIFQQISLQIDLLSEGRPLWHDLAYHAEIPIKQCARTQFPGWIHSHCYIRHFSKAQELGTGNYSKLFIINNACMFCMSYVGSQPIWENIAA